MITSLIVYESAVNDSISTLLSTGPGEIPSNPAYGINLDALFDHQSFDELFKTNLCALVKDTITRFEPRIRNISVEVLFSDIVDGVVIISINYTHMARNTRHNFVYPLYKSSADGDDILTSIDQSLKRLLSTRLGAIVSNPKYGIDLGYFYPVKLYSERTAPELFAQLIADAILLNEPRIDVHSITLDIEQENSGLIYIYVNYFVKKEIFDSPLLRLSCPCYLNKVSLALPL